MIQRLKNMCQLLQTGPCSLTRAVLMFNGCPSQWISLAGTVPLLHTHTHTHIHTYVHAQTHNTPAQLHCENGVHARASMYLLWETNAERVGEVRSWPTPTSHSIVNSSMAQSSKLPSGKNRRIMKGTLPCCNSLRAMSKGSVSPRNSTMMGAL